MQNFKLFFQILNKYKGNMLMFIGIFAGVVVSVIKANAGGPNQSNYTARTISYAIFDEDQSELSKALCAYLADTQELVEGIPNEKRALQDAIYNDDIDCSVVIPAGFGEMLVAGEGKESLAITTFADSQEAVLFETSLNNYVNIISNYLSMGKSVEEAVELTKEALAIEIKVTLPDGGNANNFNPSHFFYIYLAWIMIMIVVNGVGPVLAAFKEKECRNRIYCSSCKFSSLQGSLWAGMLLLGIALTVFFMVLSRIVVGSEVTMKVIGLQGLNLLCYTAVALSLLSLFSAITNKPNILTMLANVSSLGMSFLCGIFVPIELLSEGVVKVAHFLPAYWYGQAVDLAASEGASGYFFTCLGVELLFAVAIFVVSAVVNRKNA